MRKTIALILIIHFIFYLGCASTLESRFSFTSEGEIIPENQIDKSIYIHTSTQRNLKVELLSIRTNSIIVSSSIPISETSKLFDGQHYISELGFSELEAIVIQGHSQMWKWFKKGFKIGGYVFLAAAFVGLLATVVDEQNDGDDGSDGMWVPVYIMLPVAFVVYGFFGACVGGIAGGISPVFDRKAIRNDEIIRDTLLKYSRYPLKEPKIFSELFPE